MRTDPQKTKNEKKKKKYVNIYVTSTEKISIALYECFFVYATFDTFLFLRVSKFRSRYHVYVLNCF